MSPGTPLRARCLQCPTGRGRPPGRDVDVKAVYVPALRPVKNEVKVDIPDAVFLLECGHYQARDAELDASIERHPAGRRRGW